MPSAFLASSVDQEDARGLSFYTVIWIEPPPDASSDSHVGKARRLRAMHTGLNRPRMRSWVPVTLDVSSRGIGCSSHRPDCTDCVHAEENSTPVRIVHLQSITSAQKHVGISVQRDVATADGSRPGSVSPDAVRPMPAWSDRIDWNRRDNVS